MMGESNRVNSICIFKILLVEAVNSHVTLDLALRVAIDLFLTVIQILQFWKNKNVLKLINAPERVDESLP